MKYLLVGDDGVFSLNVGGLSFDQSLFTDTELNTCELDLTLMTQRTERKRKHFITGNILHSHFKRFSVIKSAVAVHLSVSCTYVQWHEVVSIVNLYPPVATGVMVLERSSRCSRFHSMIYYFMQLLSFT